jgi:exodeoxyribonuclease VII large subunit
MPQTPHIRLSELTGKIQETLEQAFHNTTFWVIADITNHSYKPIRNYHYFELVEKAPGSNEILAKISGKAWGNGSDQIAQFEQTTGQAFTNNIQVLINVSVVYHPTWGLQVSVNDIDTHFTMGLLEQQRQATLEKLVKENPGVIQKVGDRYFTRNQGLNLPIVLQKIALVSAKDSAGSEDFRHTLHNNPYGYRMEIDEYHSPVQGESNAEQLISCLIAVFESKVAYDAIVITRGGGSQSDFLLFDNYRIGQAVARFPIPIITGIGHQKNETIADLMAHTQTKTPTQAAEFIITHNKSFEDRIMGLQKTIIIKSQQVCSSKLQLLARINSTIVNQSRDILNDRKDALTLLRQETINYTKTILFSHQGDLMRISGAIITQPKIILYNRVNDLQNILANIRTFNAQYLKNQRGYLGHYRSLIKMMSPENILKKGFALVKINGRITSNPDEIQTGQDIDIILSDISITSTVKTKTKYHGDDFNV